jgi:hypothetical protein
MKRTVAALWAAGFAVRLILIFGLDRVEWQKWEVLRVAAALGTRGEFADPFTWPTGLTAHVAPVYPALLAIPYALFGDGHWGNTIRMILAAAIAALPYALLPWVALRLGLPRAAGLLAGAVAVCLPFHHYLESLGLFECSLIALCTVGIAGGIRNGWFVGGALLSAPNLLLPLIPSVGRRWRLWLLAALLLVPWTIRNFVSMGGLIYIRDNMPLELLVSNQDGAHPNALVNMGNSAFQSTHPNHSREAVQFIREHGELAFQRRCAKQAFDWIGRNPLRFSALCVARWREFWFPWLPELPVRSALFAVISLLAFAGLAVLFRRNRAAAVSILSLWILFSLPYAFVQSYLRYQTPLYWSLLLMASYLVVELGTRWRDRAK